MMGPGPSAPGKKTEIFKALPEIWQLIRPRRALLALGLGLMVINRVSGLVLPGFHQVSGRRRHRQDGISSCSIRWSGVVLAATLIQGLTSFALTQTLSKAAQKLIAELRRRVQEHVGRLSVAYYDANKTGMLVSRIMSDVEGVRNLIGTGLVDFVGGLLTAVIAFAVLIRISPVMTAIAFTFLLVFGIGLRKAFRVIRPIFRERAKINAEVTGRLTESLGGVRVVKGYHAEAREHDVFSSGVERLLQNVFKTLTATSVMSLSSSTLMGIIGAIVMFMGTRQILAGKLTLGGFFTYTMFLGLSGGAALPGRRHRHADHRSHRRPGAHPRSSGRDAGERRPRPHRHARRDSRRRRISRMSTSLTSNRRPCCTTSRSTRSRARSRRWSDRRAQASRPSSD